MARARYKVSPGSRRLAYVWRKILVALLLAGGIGGLTLADRHGLFGQAPQPDFQKYHDKVFSVVATADGDTLDVGVSDGVNPKTRIRLWGVDTPETKHPSKPVEHFGPQASEFTKNLVLGKSVRLELEANQTRDKYGRLLAYVYLEDGQMLNRMLIEQGYGYADPRFPHRYEREFSRLQTKAKNSRVGLWKDITPPQLPYYYRDRLKLPR